MEQKKQNTKGAVRLMARIILPTQLTRGRRTARKILLELAPLPLRIVQTPRQAVLAA